jgi:hypothetical protein
MTNLELLAGRFETILLQREPVEAGFSWRMTLISSWPEPKVLTMVQPATGAADLDDLLDETVREAMR